MLLWHSLGSIFAPFHCTLSALLPCILRIFFAAKITGLSCTVHSSEISARTAVVFLN